LRPTDIPTSHIIFVYWLLHIVIGICNIAGERSREPPFGFVFLRFVDLSISLLPEVFKDLIDAVDVAHGSLPTDPIDHNGPFECTEVTLRLGEDLVGSDGGPPCDKARYTAMRKVRPNRLELVFGGESGDDFKVELEWALRMAWRI